MSGLDAAHKKAVELVREIKGYLNKIQSEEDSKVQLIVRFLTEVLGWAHTDISSERKHDNGFSDFIISLGTKPAFLIEAKRKGELEVKSRAEKRTAYKISGPALKPNAAAIEQAAGYCTPEGIQLAIVTDGLTWIFFKPYIPGEKYKDKEAIVFPSLSSILDEFSEFYELGSKEGHQASRYKQIFDKIHQNRVLLTLGLHSAITDGDIHPDHKSQLAFDLDKVFNTYFAGLTGDNDPNLLIECFVESKESRIADFALEKLTTNVLGNIDPEGTDVGESLHKLIEHTISDEVGETVFIVGPSGAGKTTFLDRFFKKTLPKNIRERCVVAHVNALDATGDAASSGLWFTNAVIACIEKQLYPAGYPDWDQLLGLYHGDYLRRLNGVDAELYKQDKDAFKKKFGDFMEQQVEKDREGYLRRLLTDIVQNRKKLPLFVVDNTDEFSLAYKGSVFQYFQALRRHATHCLLFFPVTDKSAWSFNKTEIFNIYSSRSYFLPTPSPREVFRKRVDYLKTKIGPTSGSKTKAEYGAGKSFRLSIEDLGAFASAVEDIFVDQDYVSNRIGSLANYNIRKTLALARRIITSAALGVDDLLRSYVVGQQAPLPPEKFMKALLLGDYNFFNKTDGHLIFPVFDADKEIRLSPLMNARILALLKAMHDNRSTDESRYMEISSVTQYFDAAGYTEIAVERGLAELMSAALIGPYDSSVGNLAQAQKVAITHSGLAHLDMALFNPVFFEQLALTAMIANAEVASELRALYMTEAPIERRLRRVRQRFASYLLSEDDSFGALPDSEAYNVQRAVTSDIQKFAVVSSEAALSSRDTVGLSARSGLVASRVNGVVDWFDEGKGYGFVLIEEPHEAAFLHASVLEASGLESIHDGDLIVCDISRSHKGIAVSQVHSVAEKEMQKDKAYDVLIIRLFDDRDYGFVYVHGLATDAFFHLSVIPEQVRSKLAVGQRFVAEINTDPRGRGLQVRRAVSLGSIR